MKVNTLQLMMLVANLPVSNVFEQMVIGKQLLNSNEISTQINLLEDTLQRKRNWIAAIPKDNSSLVDAIKEFSDKVYLNYRELLFNNSKSVHIADEVIAKYSLPEFSEVDGSYSLLFAIVLITQIDDIPGYSYPMIVDFFRQSNPGMPELMMATIFCRMYGEKIHSAAFEFRDWWDKQEHKELPFSIHFEIRNKLQELQEKYNLPDFFAA